MLYLHLQMECYYDLDIKQQYDDIKIVALSLDLSFGEAAL